MTIIDKWSRNSLFDQGIHVVINARTEDDIDVDDITKKVAKSSGSNYSFHKEKPKPVETPSVVVSVLMIYILHTYCVLFCTHIQVKLMVL
jgi:hypothetical protein